MSNVIERIGQLLTSLQSPDFYEREEAVKELGRYTEDEAVAGLVLALEDTDLGIRELAADVLGKMQGEIVSQLLIRFLAHGDIGTRNLSAEILVRIGVPAVQPLVEALESDDPDVRKFVVDVLGLIGDVSTVQPLCRSLSDENANVVCSAAEALGEVGSSEAIPELVAAYQRCEDTRLQVIEALGKIGDPSCIDMLFGFLKHIRESLPSSNLVYIAYAVILLLIVWHAGSILMNMDRGGSPQMLIWDLVLLPPMLGSLAVFRRSISYAASAVAILLAFGIVDANLMDEVTQCMVMGLAAAAFLELTWANVRFDSIYELGSLGLPRNHGRPRAIFNTTMVRYMVVFGSVLMVSAIILVVISILPSWFASDPTPGVPSPVDADTVMAPFYLLLWIVVLTVAGRWTLITFMGSHQGHRTIDWIREHMLIPQRLRRRQGGNEPSVGEAREPDPGTAGVWEEESSPPEIPVPHG